MDDDGKTTINVKAVSARAWERAKGAAVKQGETMGAWLSRAINQLADGEAGPREFPPARVPPVEPVRPGPGLAAHGPASALVSPGELADVMQGMAALAAATGVAPAKSSVRRAYGLADDLVRDARGIPRRARRDGKAGGQALLENGKAELVATDETPT